MQKRSPLVVLTVALVLVASAACGDATRKPTETPKPTPSVNPTDTPQPIPTVTPVPLSQIDLEPLLTQSGDLPAGLSGAQVRGFLPEMYDNLPTSDNAIQRQFQRDGDAAGFVTVLVYESSSHCDAAYTGILDGFGDSTVGPDIKAARETISDVGERAEAVTLESEVGGISLEAIDMAFTRCHAVAHIRMTGTLSLLDIKSYAKRLDNRLAAVACR